MQVFADVLVLLQYLYYALRERVQPDCEVCGKGDGDPAFKEVGDGIVV
jgi:hypothetical protein